MSLINRVYEPGDPRRYPTSVPSRSILEMEADRLHGEFGDATVNESSNPKDARGDVKPDLSLVPPASLIHEALAMENGAKKYGPYNWRTKKVRARVYVAAALRHLSEYLDGQDTASDSNVHHLAHAKACCGILLDALETGNLIDDRPAKGAASRLLASRKHTGVTNIICGDCE